MVPSTRSTNKIVMPIDQNTSAQGSSLVVLLRPEQIALDAEHADSRTTAVVVETEFYGHDAIVRLRPNWERSTLLTARTVHGPPRGRLLGAPDFTNG